MSKMWPMPTGMNDTVRKAAEVVTARSEGGEFTALDRKLLNVLLWVAYPNMAGARIHRASISDLATYLMQGRTEKVSESLRRLWTHKLAIDYTDENNVHHSIRCHCLSFKESKVDGGILEFAFDPILMQFIENPTVFAQIALKTVRELDSKHALKLYEQMRMFLNRHYKVWQPTLDEAHRFFEVKGVYKDRFDSFRNRVVEVAVSEINALAEFDVKVEYKRAGRGNRVVSLAFTAVPKTAEQIAHTDPIPKRRRKDGDTVDMFQGLSDNEMFTAPTLRVDTMEQARRVMGSDGNVDELLERWIKEFASRGYTNDPDASFLAWIQMRKATDVAKSDEGIAYEDIYASFISGRK